MFSPRHAGSYAELHLTLPPGETKKGKLRTNVPAKLLKKKTQQILSAAFEQTAHQNKAVVSSEPLTPELPGQLQPNLKEC